MLIFDLDHRAESLEAVVVSVSLLRSIQRYSRCRTGSRELYLSRACCTVILLASRALGLISRGIPQNLKAKHERMNGHNVGVKSIARC